MIKDNLILLRDKIRRAAEKSNRRAEDIILVCVTKDRAPCQISEVIEAGVTDIGENKVREAALKYKNIENEVNWHLVGHLQTNKVKEAIQIFDMIHSLDSIKLAAAIDKEAGKIGKVTKVLLQVNVSAEETKFGVEPAHLFEILSEVSKFKNLNICGMMTIAPLVDDAAKVRPYFKNTKELFDKAKSVKLNNVDMKYLSMGMSQDFEAAIEEGANMVRIGTAIFGPRS